MKLQTSTHVTEEAAMHTARKRLPSQQDDPPPIGGPPGRRDTSSPRMERAPSGVTVRVCNKRIGLTDESHVDGVPRLWIDTTGNTRAVFDFSDVAELILELTAWTEETDRRRAIARRGRGSGRGDRRS